MLGRILFVFLIGCGIYYQAGNCPCCTVSNHFLAGNTHFPGGTDIRPGTQLFQIFNGGKNTLSEQ